MIRNILELVKIALIPVIASCAIHFLRRTKAGKSNSDRFRQIFAGILFGAVCVVCNEFGVKINGVIMNVRDAAPLCASLICGGPAGIIAGVIGGVERWLCVLWGGGTYTRIACTVATILAGLIGAFYRHKVYENKTPSFLQAGLVAILVETMHMLLVFVTHFDDVRKAFDVVRTCSIPMILANAFSVMLAVGINNLFHRKEIRAKKTKDISELFQGFLLAVLTFAFLLTTFTISFVQSGISENNYTKQLQTGINDVIRNIDNLCDDELMNKTKRLVPLVNETMNSDELMQLCTEYGVEEINIIGNDGVIVASSNPEFVHFDMKSGEQSLSFHEVILLAGEYVQPIQAITKDNSISRKYAGKRINGKYYLQVGYDAEHFQSAILEEIMLGVTNRHIGNEGYIVIANHMGNVVCDSDGNYGYTLEDIGITKIEEHEDSVPFENVVDDIECYCMYAMQENYYVIAMISVEEAETSKEASVYLTVLMDVLIMVGIFTQAYFLIKKLVVDNVRKIGENLKEITDGKLDTRVEVRQSNEFAALSDGINATVDKLKEYIDEAEKRIATELQYAKDIQASSLPSSFPAFPERTDFDIYASMKPAKSVGGDFYDFYMIDDNRLGILIADVSGKGIPAALFMMRAKELIKTYVTYGISVEDVFTNANYVLCQGNDQEMFITAWLGVVDLRDGTIEFANAGHNPPVVKRNGKYEFLNSRPGFVLAGMDEIVYRKQTAQLQPGDEIYLYTDGVTESINSEKEQFGNDRLLEILNREGDFTSQQICEAVAEAVDEFVQDEDQFDDITMLSMKYIEKHN